MSTRRARSSIKRSRTEDTEDTEENARFEQVWTSVSFVSTVVDW
jgi:hypothetical protein